MKVLYGGARIGLLTALGALSSAGVTVAFASVEPERPRRIRPAPRRRMTGFVPASINRNTGQPHEHKREIARRLRQLQRRATK